MNPMPTNHSRRLRVLLGGALLLASTAAFTAVGSGTAVAGSAYDGCMGIGTDYGTDRIDTVRFGIDCAISGNYHLQFQDDANGYNRDSGEFFHNGALSQSGVYGIHADFPDGSTFCVTLWLDTDDGQHSIQAKPCVTVGS